MLTGAVPLIGMDWTICSGLSILVREPTLNQQFKRLREARPETPLMCSEFWSGWFDHWGRKHETRPAKSMVQGIKDMLDRNISFSLYMAHGYYFRALGWCQQSVLLRYV